MRDYRSDSNTTFRPPLLTFHPTDMISNSTKKMKGQGFTVLLVAIAFSIVGYLLGKANNPTTDIFTTSAVHQQKNTAQLLPIKIPRILHHMWLGENDSKNPDGSYDPNSRIHPEWRASCLQHHPKEAGWKHYHWNYSMAESFIKKNAPWFLDAWKNYPTVTHRADSLRYLTMYYIGGVYVDSDIECWREGSDMLGEYDVVLQGSQGGGEPATNAAMASVPGHPLWKAIFKLLLERKDHNADDVGYGTGPQIISDGLYALGIDTKQDEDGHEKMLRPVCCGGGLLCFIL